VNTFWVFHILREAAQPVGILMVLVVDIHVVSVPCAVNTTASVLMNRRDAALVIFNGVSINFDIGRILHKDARVTQPHALGLETIAAHNVVTDDGFIGARRGHRIDQNRRRVSLGR
jgi:hypothetical protein